MTLEQRIMRRVWKRENGCWEWQGSKNSGGYGWICFEGKRYAVHRMIAEIFLPNFNEFLDVCHKCDNKKCINPDHLFMGTHKDNMQDMIKKGRKVVDVNNYLHGAILTKEDVQTIRSLRYKISGVELAKMFGVTKSAISAIMVGKRWRHI